MSTIDRQAAIEGLYSILFDDELRPTIVSAKKADEIIDVVRKLPEEPERNTARWIEDGYSHYKAVCSECGEPCATYVMNTPRDRFCKWCGAKMEGKNE